MTLAKDTRERWERLTHVGNGHAHSRRADRLSIQDILNAIVLVVPLLSVLEMGDFFGYVEGEWITRA